jgi:hypothetical protein
VRWTREAGEVGVGVEAEAVVLGDVPEQGLVDRLNDDAVEFVNVRRLEGAGRSRRAGGLVVERI